MARFYDLGLAIAASISRYPAETIRRLHAIINTQLPGALEGRGEGILVSRYGPTSFLVTAGTGLQVLVAPGAGVILGDSLPTASIERATSLALAVPATSTVTIWQALENNPPANRTEETGLPLTFHSPSASEPDAFALATVTTSAVAVTAIVDLRGIPIDRVDPEYVRDAVGAMLADSATLDFTYNDAADTETAEVKAGSIVTALLANSAVTSDKISGPIAPNKLGAGQADGTTALFGDGTYKPISSMDAEGVRDIVGALVVDSSTINATSTDASDILSLEVITTALADATTTTKGITWFAANGAATVGRAVQADDARLGDSRVPAGHAASHRHGGTDEVAQTASAANAIPKAGADGKLAAGWLPASGSADLSGYLVKAQTAQTGNQLTVSVAEALAQNIIVTTATDVNVTLLLPYSPRRRWWVYAALDASSASKTVSCSGAAGTTVTTVIPKGQGRWVESTDTQIVPAPLFAPYVVTATGSATIDSTTNVQEVNSAGANTQTLPSALNNSWGALTIKNLVASAGVTIAAGSGTTIEAGVPLLTAQGGILNFYLSQTVWRLK